MFDKIKQLKDLRDQANHLKSLLEQEQVTATAAAGKITLVMNGNQEIISVSIDDSLLSPEHKDELQSGIKAACADAIHQVQRVMAETMRKSGSLPF